MSEEKFTPGPWLTQRDCDGEWSIWVRHPHIGTLATAYMEDMNGEFPAMANARLIAAAPEMLEQLEWASEVLSCMIGGSAQLDALNDVIAKARGEN